MKAPPGWGNGILQAFWDGTPSSPPQLILPAGSKTHGSSWKKKPEKSAITLMILLAMCLHVVKVCAICMWYSTEQCVHSLSLSARVCVRVCVRACLGFGLAPAPAAWSQQSISVWACCTGPLGPPLCGGLTPNSIQQSLAPVSHSHTSSTTAHKQASETAVKSRSFQNDGE